MNATMEKFGYPETCVRDYERWVLVLRPQQVTLGSLVLIARGSATRFSALEAEAFREMERIVRDIESTLAAIFEYDKINYLMLMMVDPNVHFHVIPRYAATRRWGSVEFRDHGWPGPPALDRPNPLSDRVRDELAASLRARWP